MHDDYLWDGTGTVDADIERLERVLGRLRCPDRPFRFSARRRFIGAAVVALCVAAGVLVWIGGRSPAAEPSVTLMRVDAHAPGSADGGP